MHSRDRLIESSSIYIKRLDPLFREIFAFKIDIYVYYFDFLIEIAVSPIIVSINKLSSGYSCITNILRYETIALGEPNIVIDDD
jgi:hypothetical protein